MHLSFRVRLFIGFLMVALSAVALVALLTGRGVASGFGQFLSQSEQVESQAIVEVLEYQLAQDGVEGIGPFANEIGSAFGRSITLTDENGDVIFPPSGGSVETDLIEEQLFLDDAAPPIGLTVVDGAVQFDAETETRSSSQTTTTIIDGVLTRTITSPAPAETFLNETNNLLLTAVLVGLLLAGVASLWLSRSFMQPVAALTDAAEHLAEGDLSQRVVQTGPDELGRLASSFNAMAAGLEQQERLRRTMVGDIAHELRTPLGNVRGYLEAIQDGVVAPDPATIDSLLEETVLLGRLVDDLQTLSLAEAGQLQMTLEPVAAGPLLEAAARAQRPQAEAKEIALTVTVPPALPDMLADGERLAQVVGNLLANALAHTPPGGTVTLEAAAQDGGVRPHRQRQRPRHRRRAPALRLRPLLPGRPVAGAGQRWCGPGSGHCQGVCRADGRPSGGRE